MYTTNIQGAEELDKRYLARCIRKLKEWGAPLDHWECIDVIDVREDDEDGTLSECELCGCANVRYEHVMMHELYFETVTVGCICAGIMEGDILRAKERERRMRNRAKRKKSFIAKKWSQPEWDTYRRQHRGHEIMILQNPESYAVYVDGQVHLTYKGEVIRDFLSAAYRAFELADPVKEVLTI